MRVCVCVCLPTVCECNLLLTRKTMPKYEANNFRGRPQKSFGVHYVNESFFNVIATMRSAMMIAR